MESQIFGIIGSVLMLVAIAALWIGRLNSTAKKLTTSDDGHIASATEESGEPVTIRTMKIEMIPHTTPAEVQHQPEKIEVLAAESEPEGPGLIEDVEVLPQEDCSDAAINLQLADQLKVVGDFEGVAEYAKLVLEMKTSSARQRARAQSLLRREMAR
ncbi:TPA: hypothetical protein ACP32N_003161 [Pseudomonas aeruginosa]